MNIRAVIKSLAVATLVLGMPTAAYANTQNFSGYNAERLNYRLPSNGDNDFTLAGPETGYISTDVYGCGTGTYSAKYLLHRSFYPDEEFGGHAGAWCSGAFRGTGTWDSGKYHWDLKFPVGNSSTLSGFLKVPA